MKRIPRLETSLRKVLTEISRGRDCCTGAVAGRLCSIAPSCGKQQHLKRRDVVSDKFFSTWSPSYYEWEVGNHPRVPSTSTTFLVMFQRGIITICLSYAQFLFPRRRVLGLNSSTDCALMGMWFRRHDCKIGGWAVPDKAFRGPEAHFFEGPHLFNKKQCLMVSP